MNVSITEISIRVSRFRGISITEISIRVLRSRKCGKLCEMWVKVVVNPGNERERETSETGLDGDDRDVGDGGKVWESRERRS